MRNQITLYHGSEKIIEKPTFGKGSPFNDYGKGFYCTENFDLACEWAAKRGADVCYVNEYTLNLFDLNILDLSRSPYTILHWITLLLQNRTFTSQSAISSQAKSYLVEHFGLNVDSYDLIKGYRADDSYFSFAKDFVNNTISVQKLARAMKLGKLGIQHTLRSEKAFSGLAYIGYHKVDSEKYFGRYQVRDQKARSDYSRTRGDISMDPDELYIMDILRGGIHSGDPRLQ